MNKKKLAEEIHAIGEMIAEQQRQNSALTEKMIPGLEAGLDMPNLQDRLSAGVNRVIDLGEKQNKKIDEWFKL